MISNIGVLLIYPFFCYVVIKSSEFSSFHDERNANRWQSILLDIVHHNVRLQLCTAASFYSIGVLVRFYLFYCQYTVVPDDGKTIYCENVKFVLQKLFTPICLPRYCGISHEHLQFHCRFRTAIIKIIDFWNYFVCNWTNGGDLRMEVVWKGFVDHYFSMRQISIS